MNKPFRLLCLATLMFTTVCLPPTTTVNAQDKSGQKSGDKKSDDKKSDDKKSDDKKKTTNRSSQRTKAFSKRSKDFVSLFDSVTASATSATVRIKNGKRVIALGAVVDPNGFIVTKASEMRGKLECELSDGSKLTAQVYGIDPETDLALLKVEAQNLPSIHWSADATPTIGHWLASPNGGGKSLGVGVVSVNVRPIPPGGGFLGIMPAPATTGTGVRISQVTSDTPADKAGLLTNDTIIKIDKEEITNILKLRETLRNYAEGDLIDLTIKRGDKEMVIPLRLSDSRKQNPMFDRSNSQNSMGSTLSRRRLDFPQAFQHDSQLSAKDCGGPIVDLSGQVVGINIARAGRVKTLALPADIVVPIVEQLKSGKFSPVIVNKVRISEVEAELKEISKKSSVLPKQQRSLEKKLATDKARQEEIQRLLDEMETRLQTLKESTNDSAEKLGAVKKELKGFEATEIELKKERTELTTGKR